MTCRRNSSSLLNVLAAEQREQVTAVEGGCMVVSRGGHHTMVRTRKEVI